MMFAVAKVLQLYGCPKKRSNCHEDFSDKIIGSWLTQTDETSEIWSYHADGTSDCAAYYYHSDEQFDITDAESVNAIHTTICNAVETIKDCAASSTKAIIASTRFILLLNILYNFIQSA